MARVLNGFHSFTCLFRVHPLTEWPISAFSFRAEAGTHLPTREGWKAKLAGGRDGHLRRHALAGQRWEAGQRWKAGQRWGRGRPGSTGRPGSAGRQRLYVYLSVCICVYVCGRCYCKASRVLEQYQHMPSFHGIQQDCQLIVEQLRARLKQQFHVRNVRSAV